jgi:Uma2 family endonuclease
MAVQEHATTVKDFEIFLARPENTNQLFELVNGEIVQKVPTEEHGIIAGNIITWINMFLLDHPIGRAAVEARHRAPDDQYNDRLPDVSFVADMSRAVVREGAVPFIPDLALEIKSPNDTLKEMSETGNYYLTHGAKMVWLVYPEKRLVEVLTPTERLLLTEDETLTGGDVLPGFAVVVRDVFRGV